MAFFWSHLRRKFYELYVGGNRPTATEAVSRIKKLYEIEAEIRGLPPEVWRALRQDNAKLLADALNPWLAESLAGVPMGSKLGEALCYGLNQWDGLVRYLGDRTHRYAVYTTPARPVDARGRAGRSRSAGAICGASSTSSTWAATSRSRPRRSRASATLRCRGCHRALNTPQMWASKVP